MPGRIGPAISSRDKFSRAAELVPIEPAALEALRFLAGLDLPVFKFMLERDKVWPLDTGCKSEAIKRIAEAGNDRAPRRGVADG